MGDNGTSSSSSLLYFPSKQFSPRFGDCFFTVEILSFTKKKASSKLCCISDVIFYEVQVKRGRMEWRVFRRYTEFAALFESIDRDDIAKSYDSSLAFPRKSFYNNFIYDPAFLESRKEKLESILDKILTAASTRSVAITQCPAVTSFLELGEDHNTPPPLT